MRRCATSPAPMQRARDQAHDAGGRHLVAGAAGSPGTKRSIASTAADAAMLAAPRPRSVARRSNPVRPMRGRLGPRPRHDRAARRRSRPSSGLGGRWSIAASLLLVGRSRRRPGPARTRPRPAAGCHPGAPIPPARPVSTPGDDGATRTRSAPGRSRSVAASRSAAPRRRRRPRSARRERDLERVGLPLPPAPEPRHGAGGLGRDELGDVRRVAHLHHDDAELPGVHADPGAEPAERSSWYGLFETSMRSADSCSLPPGPVYSRSKPSLPGPSSCGIISAVVPSLLSRYASDWTIRA